jgi:phosphohistidine phosphatase SixA
MDLYLVRHGIAGDADPNQWPDDRDRPLTARGEKRFARAACGLRVVAAPVEVMLASPLARAWRTAELLAEHAGWPAPTACEALAAGADPAALLGALEPYREAPRLALVGHEPSLHEVTSYLLTGDPAGVAVEFRKGAVVHLRVRTLAAGAGVLQEVLQPKALRALAP